MSDLNRVMLIGRLTRDPQLKFLPNQTAICEGGIAVGRKWKGADGQEKEDTTFIDFAIFGKAGETFNQYMQKGKQIYLEGRLKFDSWDDKQTNQKRTKLSVVVENFIFIGPKTEPQSQPPSASPSRPGGYGADRSGGEHLPSLPPEPAQQAAGDVLPDTW